LQNLFLSPLNHTTVTRVELSFERYHFLFIDGSSFGKTTISSFRLSLIDFFLKMGIKLPNEFQEENIAIPGNNNHSRAVFWLLSGNLQKKRVCCEMLAHAQSWRVS